MRIDRRSFLAFASTSPLIFGLGDLFACAQDQEPPAWWRAALDRMKELGRPGLVFVAPEVEVDRDVLAGSLRDLLESGDSRAQEIFCGAVVTCLRPEFARACLAGDVAPGQTLVLDSSGRIIEKRDRFQSLLRNSEVFEDQFSRLVYGEGDSRLSAAAERLRAKLTESQKSAFADLIADSVETRERASAEIAKQAEVLMPLLIFERRASKDSERAARLRLLVAARFQAADEKTPGPRLPFGTRYDPGMGCGVEVEEGVSIQCGMARLEGKGQRFLRFLEK